MAKKNEYILSLKREKAIRNLAILALVVAILSVSISYAAVSKNIHIINYINDGNGSVIDKISDDDSKDNKTTTKRSSTTDKDNSSNVINIDEDNSEVNVSKNFDVGFYNLAKLYSSNGVVISNEPKITNIDKTIEGFDVTFNRPGQYVLYMVDIRNKENTNGKISSIKKYISLCDENETHSDDENLICESMKLDIYYTTTGTLMMVGDTLDVGESKNITIKLSYDANKLPSKTVDINEFRYLITYTESE